MSRIVIDSKAVKPIELNGYIDEQPPVVPTIEMVDLGLPSGTLWSKYDFGVDSESLNVKADYIGGRYAWGELHPKDTYDEDNYRFYDTQNEVYTKYTNSGDEKYKLDDADDVVHATFGENYYIPTALEYQELVREVNKGNLTKQYVTNFNGVSGLNGVKISKSSNANVFIFLPITAPNGWAQYWADDRVGYYGKRPGVDYVAGAFEISNSPSLNVDTYERYEGYRLRAVVRNPEYDDWSWDSGSGGKSLPVDDDDDDEPIWKSL